MLCNLCKMAFREGCCSCIALPGENLECVHFVKNHSGYEQQFWRCASCRNPKDTKTSSPVVVVDPDAVTLETVLKEILSLKSQLSELPALKNDVSTIKESIRNLELGDCTTEIKSKIDHLDTSVFIAKASIQQLDRKIDSMKEDIDLISENGQKIKNETLPYLDCKLCDLDTTICQVEENINNEMKSIRDEVGLSNVALLGIFSKMDVYQLQERLNSTQSDVKSFKTQTLFKVEEIKKEIADLKAEKELSINKISKLKENSSWVGCETASKKVSYIQNEIQLFKKQVLASELERKKEISILKTTKKLNCTKVADLAKNTSEVMKEFKLKADSIETQITSAMAQVSENSQALKKKISDLEFNDYAIHGKIVWLNIKNSATVLETDVIKQIDSYLNEISIVKTHVSNTKNKINEFYELEKNKMFSDCRLVEGAEHFLVDYDMSSLQVKSSVIETEIAIFKTFDTPRIKQDILNKITDLNVVKESSKNIISELRKKILQFEENANSLENDMKIVKMQISTSEQEIMEALNNFQTEKESELNKIVDMTRGMNIKQNHQFKLRDDRNHDNNSVGTSHILDTDFATTSNKIEKSETTEGFASCHPKADEETSNVKSVSNTDTKDEDIKTETEINDQDSVRE